MAVASAVCRLSEINSEIKQEHNNGRRGDLDVHSLDKSVCVCANTPSHLSCLLPFNSFARLSI